MRKLNFSLVIKIACIILLAFLAVLGNEIRLGIERYIKNTLETDAEITIRNLDKFAKNYIERIAVNPVDLIFPTIFKIISSCAFWGFNESQMFG